MSDFVWSSRLAVWIGAVILFVQAVTGRGVGVVTLLGVLLLAGGLLFFLGGLAKGERDLSSLLQFEGGGPTPPPTVAEATAPRAAASPVPEADVAPAPELPAVDEHVGQAVPDEAAPPPAEKAEPVPEAPSRRVETVEVVEGSAEAGLLCPRCGQEIETGQMAVTCFVCRAVHHAGCWINNHFHCATPGCSGAGSLEAPRAGTVDR